MHNFYINRFEAAYLRSEKYNLNPPRIKYSNDVLLTNTFKEKLPYLLLKEHEEYMNVANMIANCMGFHYKVKPTIEKYLSSDVYFTLGYVSIYDKNIFYFDDKFIEDSLENGMQEQPNIHAWLTLPTMEIIDFTLPATYAIMNQLDYNGEVIIKHADKLKDGMNYNPVLIGDTFLRKIGALIEIKDI